METTLGIREVRVALVDDHPVFRIGLAAILARQPGLNVVADSGSPYEVLKLAATQPFDVALVDVLLPELGGAQVVTQLRALQPACQILGLSMIDDPARIALMIRAGASGFVHKSQPVEQIFEAIQMVLGGVRYLPPSIAPTQIDDLLREFHSAPIERLTSREREVFMLMIDGMSNDDISSKLFIARRTVETHRYHVMHKLGARTSVDLLRLALRWGVAEP